MQKLDFGEKLDLIVQQDPRYDREAYLFLRDALDFTVKLRKKAKEGTDHVSGQQLLDGIRQFALKQYGPMVVTVFTYWGSNAAKILARWSSISSGKAFSGNGFRLHRAF